ncbi:MAG TPA: alpha/beta fold hydrolase [Capillimicrobium sp.]|nr:alpha/beta fold hydrolase [Capillimicrobium sp.]
MQRGDVRLYYELAGDGPAVLFTHGFAASSRMFSAQLPAVARTHAAIAWDMRGHGASDYPDDPAAYSTPLVMEDMLALLDGAGAERAVLVGHSVGGYLSLRFAVLHPERVRGLVLVDCAPGYRRDDRRAEWNRYCERRAAAFEAEGLGALTDSDEVRVAGHRDATGLAHAARGILTQQDALVIDALPTLAVPTLAVAGRHDVYDGYDYVSPVEYMAGKIPQAELTIFEHSAHAPCMTEPDAFNRRLASFLESIEERP